MKKTINGEKYKFLIKLTKYRNTFYFEIKAIFLHNKVHSYINNINGILSQFDINTNDFEKMESIWKVKEKEGKRFFEQTVDFISDIDFINYLEKQLDSDRELDEWNKY